MKIELKERYSSSWEFLGWNVYESKKNVWIDFIPYNEQFFHYGINVVITTKKDALEIAKTKKLK